MKAVDYFDFNTLTIEDLQEIVLSQQEKIIFLQSKIANIKKAINDDSKEDSALFHQSRMSEFWQNHSMGG